MNERAYKSYMLGLLVVIQAFATIDGVVIGVVLQSIKLDLRLSDTELGFLTGMAYALFYSVMGLPIARWADRGNRVLIIGLSAAAWSIMVFLCGRVASYVQLLLVRVGVAVGEAGCTPSANSLIADYFSRAERPRAISIYMLGASLGLLIGFLSAGWLNQVYGWRVTFMALGLPGLVPALLAWLTLREPRHASGAVSAPVVQPPFLEVCRKLWRSQTFRHLLYCFSVGSFFNSGMGQWEVAFFIRSFGLKTGALGAWFSVIYGFGSALGLYWGGHLASRYAANNERLQLKAMALAYCFFGLIMALRYLSPNLHLAFIFLAIGTVGGATISGPLFATIHTLVPARMRATAIAIIYLAANLIGGLGPLAVGATSDALHTLLGQESLRYAMLILTPGYLWCGWHLWLGSKTVVADLAAAHVAHEGEWAEFP